MLNFPGMREQKLQEMSPLVLAYVGDAVYELAIRTRLVEGHPRKIKDLHDDAVGFTCARAQAGALQDIAKMLTEEEMAVVKKGRNAKRQSYPRKAGAASYRMSTGLEALLGYLYLKGDSERLQEVLDSIINSQGIGDVGHEG